METDVIQQLRKEVASELGVPAEQVHCTRDGDTVVITVSGQFKGKSVKNAARRRQLVASAARRILHSSGLRSIVTFAAHDAISELERLLMTNAAFALAHNPDSLHISMGRTGRTFITVTIARTDESDQLRLTRVFVPVLQSAGLSLAAISLVSPIRGDVSDARLLRAVKILSPCNSSAVAQRLGEKEGIEISAELVHRRLDLLRQKGLLIYLGDRQFGLTRKGLSSLPVSRRRDSSDVERALALARAKW